MRFLDWAPSLHGGICLSRNGNEEIIAEDGVLTVEAISCKDLYPKDSYEDNICIFVFLVNAARNSGFFDLY